MVVISKKDSKVLLLLLGVGTVGVRSFSPSSTGVSRTQHFAPSISSLSTNNEHGAAVTLFDKKLASNMQLAAANSSGEGGKKKRRRKRKKDPVAQVDPAPKSEAVVEFESLEGLEDDEEMNVADIKNVANFSFAGPGGLDGSSPQSIDESAVSAPMPSSSVEEVDGSIPLPDIKDTMRQKQITINKGNTDEDSIMPKTKINRGDRQALLKLLEQDPYADGDDSFFQEEEYTTVSALLGERAKPFLGIPIGPLQVGHFIGALVIVLMAFIEYPGFPLTNLPTPIRSALQGGLGTIYGINIILAILASFKAGERGQPAPLWMAKTFTVGGLAFDQLTQLPTLEQIETAKARKGKRALKNMKKK
mmetsp:Transcript_9665/g.20946  ORF Transcript_9665/g.20946 Transcript_9665/m.20946 type:complete len:361 (-) Transcript_9665:204-1286(-)|eukprot:CAMPEP_0168192082 /NCGR_PEP_ID=MMETSP0139_2-20121125/17856_1 /TAXON_ID=44445 /ORGANISM="Pseudo-nitzschia australis, Strain 10249 10 AB" /LENGTH=360 /DNA_ID=CAMNT_0008115293 /DNA_START=55 /DNA_END=1137 /DNA_ORIENTATION=+